MATVYLALGSNVGNSAAHLQRAIHLLGSCLSNINQAPVYVSKAVGYTDQADFLNTAISGETNLSPQELLVFVKNIEQDIGRVERFRWGPREIDIDLIFHGNLIQNTDQLTLPHPHFRERDFVLQPLHDIAPTMVDPISHQTIKELLEQIQPNNKSIIRQVGRES